MTASGYNFKMFITGPMLYMNLMTFGFMIFMILMMFIQQKVVVALIGVIYGLSVYIIMVTQERNEFRKKNGLRVLRTTVKHSKMRPPEEMDFEFKNYYELELSKDLPFDIKETEDYKMALALEYDQQRKEGLRIAEIDSKHKAILKESPKEEKKKSPDKEPKELKEIPKESPKKEKNGNEQKK